MRCTFHPVSFFVQNLKHFRLDILSIWFHDFDRLTDTEFISLFNPVASILFISYNSQIGIFFDIGITVVDLGRFIRFSTGKPDKGT